MGRRTLAEYKNLFARAGGQHLRVGEATVRYLYSQVALSRILAFSEDPLFIVCVRNPMEMAVSCHSHLLRDGKETETDFIRAWRLQTPRSRGKGIPFLCEDYKNLLYGPVCLLGKQLERVYDKVEPNRVHVVILEDMKENPEREYKKILTFLGLPSDQCTHFPVHNERYHLPSMVAKSIRTAVLMRNTLRIRKGVRAGIWIHTWARRILGHSVHPMELPPAFLAELRDYFRADVEKLGGLLERDLTGWLMPRTPSSQRQNRA